MLCFNPPSRVARLAGAPCLHVNRALESVVSIKKNRQQTCSHSTIYLVPIMFPFMFVNVQFRTVLSSFQTWEGRIKREAAELKKDNDFIYHDRMPDIDSLAPIGRAALAKSLPLSKPASSSFADLFTKLVPMAVHNALQAYESRKGEIINFEVGRLREGTQLMNRLVVN